MHRHHRWRLTTRRDDCTDKLTYDECVDHVVESGGENVCTCQGGMKKVDEVVDDHEVVVDDHEGTVG